jgi:hypothetical protein
MNQPVMKIVQQTPNAGCVTLGAEACTQSITLRTGRQASVLKVERGMAWVTLPGTPSLAPQDQWLQAGQTLPLAGRQVLWVDGWPHAELYIHGLERAPARERLLGILARLTARLRRRVATSQRPCSAV